MEQVRLFLENEEKTLELGEMIGKNLNVPSLVYLEGDLGTGKTYLSKGIAKGLGIKEDITSPTFTLINEYNTDKVHLYHLDLYRLDNLNQVLDLGIEDFIDNEDSIVLIEWSEKLGGFKLSENILEIKIFYNETGRNIVLETESPNFKYLMEEIKKIADTWN